MLLSRARDGMVLIGNSRTLLRGAASIWHNVLEHIRERGVVSRDGLPTRCERHPTYQCVLDPTSFGQKAHLGGCDMPCGGDLR